MGGPATDHDGPATDQVENGIPPAPPVRKNGPPGKHMCRAAVWGGADGDWLYTVASASRGSAHVSCWAPDLSTALQTNRGPESINPEASTTLRALLAGTSSPAAVACVSEAPVLALAVRSDGGALACGTVEGCVRRACVRRERATRRRRPSASARTTKRLCAESDHTFTQDPSQRRK